MVVEHLISSLGLLNFPNSVIIVRFFVGVFADDVLNNSSIFKNTLPNHLLRSFIISYIVVKGKVISFNPNGPQHDTSKEQPSSREFTLCGGNITDKDPMFRVNRSPRSLRPWFCFHDINNLNGKNPMPCAQPYNPKNLCVMVFG